MLTLFFGTVVLAIALCAAIILTAGAVSALKTDPSKKLVVYGSLAPGEKNHDVISHMKGSWRPCTIQGVLDIAPTGYRIFTKQHDGPPVQALLFESDDLPAGWKALDEFEGDAYRRMLIPVVVEGKNTVANIYVRAESTSI